MFQCPLPLKIMEILKKMNPTFNYHFDPLCQYIRLCVANIFSWLQRLSLFIDFEARLCFYPFIVMLYFSSPEPKSHR